MRNRQLKVYTISSSFFMWSWIAFTFLSFDSSFQRTCTMLHFAINVTLFVGLLVLVMINFATNPETFLHYGPFKATPTTPPMPEIDASVFSSLPPQADVDSSWTYAVPYQSTCTSVGNVCKKGQKFICNLTPHNQRKCQWI